MSNSHRYPEDNSKKIIEKDERDLPTSQSIEPIIPDSIKPQKNKKRKAIILEIALVIVLMGSTAVVAYNWSDWFPNKRELISVNAPTVDTSSKNDETSRMTSNPNAGTGTQIPGFDRIDFKAGKLTQTVSFINPEQNNCYFVISIVLPDGEEIYKSDMLLPGQILTEIDLNRKLTMAIYNDAQIKYSCFSLVDGKTPMNGAVTKVKLVVT